MEKRICKMWMVCKNRCRHGNKVHEFEPAGCTGFVHIPCKGGYVGADATCIKLPDSEEKAIHS